MPTEFFLALRVLSHWIIFADWTLAHQTIAQRNFGHGSITDRTFTQVRGQKSGGQKSASQKMEQISSMGKFVVELKFGKHYVGVAGGDLLHE